MKLLVTGGAGFMGSNFIRYILNEYPDYQVTNLDKLTYAGNLSNLTDLESNPNYKFVKGDICNPELLSELVKHVDVIINYAAETHVDRSISDPTSFAQTNVLGVLNILQAAKEAGNKKVIQISTDEVFGSLDEGSFREDSPFSPNSPYAASKAGGDLLCRSYYITYGLPVIVTHSCNFYGPYQFPEKFISLSITNLLEGKKIPVYGDGKQVREWIFTQDHCRAIDATLHKGTPGEVYNIGSGYEKENLDIANSLVAILGKPKDDIEFVTDRPGHDRRYSLDSSKLRQELGWSPEFSFEEGLKQTVEWYENNQGWWKELKEKNAKYYQEQYGSSSK